MQVLMIKEKENKKYRIPTSSSVIGTDSFNKKLMHFWKVLFFSFRKLNWASS